LPGFVDTLIRSVIFSTFLETSEMDLFNSWIFISTVSEIYLDKLDTDVIKSSLAFSKSPIRLFYSSSPSCSSPTMVSKY
jgi:hypothetical protein